jgi:hypothetical protein
MVSAVCADTVPPHVVPRLTHHVTLRDGRAAVRPTVRTFCWSVNVKSVF